MQEPADLSIANSAPVTFERKVVYSLAALYTFRMFGLFMLLPVLALYGTEYAHHSPFLLGVAWALTGLVRRYCRFRLGFCRIASGASR